MSHQCPGTPRPQGVPALIDPAFVGLDARARSIAASGLVVETGEVLRASFGYDAEAVAEWCGSLPQPVRCVYESGPTSFDLQRRLALAGVPCEGEAGRDGIHLPAGDRSMARGATRGGPMRGRRRPCAILDGRSSSAEASECAGQHADIRLAVVRRIRHAGDGRRAEGGHRTRRASRRIRRLALHCLLTRESTYQGCDLLVALGNLPLVVECGCVPGLVAPVYLQRRLLLDFCLLLRALRFPGRHWPHRPS